MDLILQDMPPDVVLARHFPLRHSVHRRPTRPSRKRAYNFPRSHCLIDYSSGEYNPVRQLRIIGRAGHSVRANVRSNPAALPDRDEAIALARCPDPLPSDHDRLGGRKEHPSLERQEAFRDKYDIDNWNRRADEDEELYRLGILYDDEHLRGSGFSLDAIVHDDPVWNLNYRPHKRHRRHEHSDVFGWYNVSVPPVLPLDLSFSELGHDEALAQYLLAPSADELASYYAPATASQPVAAASPVVRPEIDASVPDLLMVTYDAESDSSPIDVDEDEEATQMPEDQLEEEEGEMRDDAEAELRPLLQSLQSPGWSDAHSQHWDGIDPGDDEVGELEAPAVGDVPELEASTHDDAMDQDDEWLEVQDDDEWECCYALFD